MLDLITDPQAWAALVTLIVLGIDNIVFISILVSRCSPAQALHARQIGLSLAFIFRVAMLFGLTWLMRLTMPLFSLFGMGISWRDLILIGGGLDDFEFHIPRGYIYFAMAFAGAVEAVNVMAGRNRRRRHPT